MSTDTEFNEWVVFFRLYAVGATDEDKIWARDRLAARWPAEFAAAQELGPMGRAEQRAWARWRRPTTDANAAAVG